MTSPSGPSNFEYSEDSVVARLSFDVPPQALTDARQLAEAMAAVATQQEYIARSTGTWLDYYNQVPQIMERANQAYRETITQLERMAYIQNEMGGGKANIGPSTGDPSGGYSTAAPQGYVNPFAGQFFGMGVTPDLTNAQQHMMGMAAQNPQMYANMMGARGNAVNPALLGMVGGIAAGATGQAPQSGGGMGQGGPAAASQSPQATQSQRKAAAPPDSSQSGAPTTSEPQNIPAQPHPDAPAWQQAVAGAIAGAQQIVNEGQAGAGGRSKMLGMAGAALGAGAMAMNKIGDNPGGNASSRLASIAKGAGLAGAVGTGAWLASKVQDVGEQVTKYSQLGSVQGGGLAEGVGYEAQARLMALNPFITAEQSRQVMQMALREGFRGGQFDTVQDFMIKNFKDMGMSLGDQMELIKSSVVAGGESTQTFKQNMDDLQNTLTEMKLLAGEGGASLPDRAAQLQSNVSTLTSLNVGQDSAQRAGLAMQEMFKDNKILREAAPGLMNDAAKNPLFMQQVALRHGITGLPGAIPGKLEDAGIDMNQAFLEQAQYIIDNFIRGQYQDDRDAAVIFQQYMAEQGVPMDQNTAYELYKQLTSGRDIAGDTGRSVASAEAKRRLRQKQGPGIVQGTVDSLTGVTRGIGKPLEKIGSLFTNAFRGDSEAAQQDFEDLPGAFGGGASQVWNSMFGSARSQVDQQMKEARENASRGGSAPVQTQGTVSGEVRITVDQQGRVTAPQSIQLSGQQKSANAGYGNAQLNNAPPGDPSFGHSFLGWGGN